MRSLSISQRGTTQLLNRVQRAADRATAFNAPRLTTGARSLNDFSSRIADRFPPIAAKYETRAMAAKPRQDMPLAEVGVPSLSPVDTPIDFPADETAAPSPFAAPTGAIQRRPAANSAAAHRAAPSPIAASPIAASSVAADSVAPTRLQRAVETRTPPTPTSEGDHKIDRASLPSITSQLRQMRPSTMPKPKEAAPAEPISYNLPPIVQRTSEPADSTSHAVTPSAPIVRPTPPSIQADDAPRLRRAPEVRRMPRAQITEVTSRPTESTLPPSTPPVPEVTQDIAPEATRPAPISSNTLPPSTVARAADGSSPPSQAMTPPPDAPLQSAAQSAPDVPLTIAQAATSPAAMSPRQLARLFSAARPSVQRQAESASQTETTSSNQPPVAPQMTLSQMTVSPEETRVRRFVETVQREARAFVGQVGEQESGTRDEGSGIGEQAETVQRAPDQVETTPPAQVAPRIQRTLDQMSEVEPATSTVDQMSSPTIQRTVDQTDAPSAIEAASPSVAHLNIPANPLQRAPVDVNDRVEPGDKPDQSRAPLAQSLAVSQIQRQIAPADNAAPLIEETNQFTSDVLSPSVAPIQTTPAAQSDRPVIQRSVESTTAVSAAADLPVNRSARVDALPELADVAEAVAPSPMPRVLGEVADKLPDYAGATQARIQRQPEVASQMDNESTYSVPHIQTEASPIATVQREVAPEADQVAEAAPRESVTAQLRRRIADQAVQRRAAETESSEQSDESAATLESASSIQAATTRTEVQRLPDLPLIQRAQADRSDAEEPSAARPERKPPSTTTAPVEHIQRASEPVAVSSAPANRVQRVLGEADGNNAAIDLDKLAREVYPIVKRMIAIERERRG